MTRLLFSHEMHDMLKTMIVLVENCPSLYSGSDSKDNIWCWMLYWQPGMPYSEQLEQFVVKIKEIKRWEKEERMQYRYKEK